MLKRLVLTGLWLVASCVSAAAARATLAPDASQQRAGAPDDGVSVLVHRLEDAVRTNAPETFTALFEGVDATSIERYTRDLFLPGAVRIVVRERDRSPLEGAPPGDGYHLVLEIFAETRGRGRLVTASLDVRRPAGGDMAAWRVVRAEAPTSLDNLYRLRLNTSVQHAAQAFHVTSEDVRFTLRDGVVFVVDSDEGVTGLVLLGRGEMQFSPAPETERGQLRLFSGGETLLAPFDSAFVRLNPRDYATLATPNALTSTAADPRLVKRAQEVYARESPRSLSVDLKDLSADAWHLLPPRGDLVAEVDTKKYDVLSYTRSGQRAEDVSLIQRATPRLIAMYSSASKMTALGRFYNDDLFREYDVLDYSLDVAINPVREAIDGRARLTLRTRASLSSITLQLAESLEVTAVTSVELGRLVYLRVRNQSTLVINLPRMLAQDADITLFIDYAGRLPSHGLDGDALQLSGDDPLYVLSTRAPWYPQNLVSDYATASIRATVPSEYICIASGEPGVGRTALVRDGTSPPKGAVFTFHTERPLRYLSLIVGRLTAVANKTLTVAGRADDDAAPETIAMTVAATSRQEGRGKELLRPLEDILTFYASVTGGAPYPAMTVALIESTAPGGHSPGYFAILKEPVSGSPLTWRNDPAAFDGFPEFFLAHEVAHQWWGQAVGWKNYHDQWISEGFAQYFASLYAQRTRGERVFGDMIRQFRRWALAESDQGPVNLGYRLGHIKGDSRVFRALVYNKGAGVLHMLRRLLGDEAFFAGLRRLYQDRRYQKAGTDDVRRAFEAESGRDLQRFFERWIAGTTIPVVRYRATIGERAVVLRFEQVGERVFDLPVTVTVVTTDGRSNDVVVPVTDTVVEQTIPTAGPVRQVLVNRDSAALAEFEELPARR